VAAALGEAFIAVLAGAPRSWWPPPCISGRTIRFYGRYWGAAADLHSLHFETCYHQGIEYCIRHGLQRFEPAAG